MGQGARESSQRRYPCDMGKVVLEPPGFRFHLFPACDVTDDRPYPDVIAPFIPEKKGSKFHVQYGTVFLPVFLFIYLGVPTGQNLLVDDLLLDGVPLLRCDVAVGKLEQFVR